MDKIKRVLVAGSVFSLLWITGCRDIEVATTVHQDGSLERTVTVRGDSSSLLGSKFPVPVEPVWTIRKEKEASGDKYVYTATKTFKDAGELNRYFDPDTAARIRMFVEVKKRFRWFSTFIGYREILRSQNPFRLVPYSDFLTG